MTSDRRTDRRRLAATACEIRRDLRPRLSSPRLRADRLCSIRVMILEPPHPSIGITRKKRATRRALRKTGTRPPGRLARLDGATAPAPQSKPVTHVPRLVAPVAPSVAFGLGVRIPAAGPVHQSLYSYRGASVNQTTRASAPVRGIGTVERPFSAVRCLALAFVLWSSLRRERQECVPRDEADSRTRTWAFDI
jgi:hypothetical protein